MCAGLKAAQAFEEWTIIVAQSKACVDFHVALQTGPVSHTGTPGKSNQKDWQPILLAMARLIEWL